MDLSIIVATDEGGAIGAGGKIPWHLPADLKHFKELTMGHPVIMGRKTFESIGKPLPGRVNIVITTDSAWKAEGCIAVQSFSDAIRAAENRLAGDSGEIFVIGGGRVYETALPHVKRVYLTRVRDRVTGDTFFPTLNDVDWQLVNSEKHSRDEKNPVDYEFQVYERKN